MGEGGRGAECGIAKRMSIEGKKKSIEPRGTPLESLPGPDVQVSFT